VDNVILARSEQAGHLPYLANSSGSIQFVNGATRGADFVRESSDFAQCDEFRNTVDGMVMAGNVRQQSFQTAGLQRQADVAHAHRTGGECFRFASRGLKVGHGHGCNHMDLPGRMATLKETGSALFRVGTNTSSAQSSGNIGHASTLHGCNRGVNKEECLR